MSFRDRTSFYEKDTVKRNLGIAAFAALVAAIAVWNASPAGAETVVAQAAPTPAVTPAAKPATSVSPAPSASSAPSPSPSPTASPVPKAFSISGYADAGYSSASHASSGNNPVAPFIAPADPNGAFISGRVFDNLANEAMFHAFNIQAAYAPTNGFGGKIEYIFGDDADIIHSYPQSLQSPANEYDLTQGYASYTGGPFNVIVGKFETLAGAEVIESPSDLNFSRSILFGYAIPFTHTGGRITYAVNSNLSLIAGANQGWDVTKTLKGVNDDNALTYEYALAWNPSKAFSFTAQGYTGVVPQGFLDVGAGRPVRTLTDFVATFHVTPVFTVVLNGDYAQQTHTLILDSTGACLLTTSFACQTGTVSWDGAALYASYVSGLFTVSGRGEYFADIGGSRTGADRRLTEGTATLSYAPNPNFILRGELRYDFANGPYYVSSTSLTTTPAFTLTNNNPGFGLEAIVRWP